jgi:hypothetical protein
MRKALSLAIVGIVAATAIQAQTVIGRYSIQNPQGAPIVLVLEADGPGKIKGSLSGNGVSFAVQGEVGEEGAAGTMRGASGSAVFEAARQGTQLAMILVELGRDGRPDPATARQLTFTADANAAPAQQGSGASAAAPGSGAGGAASPSGNSAQDQQLSQLLLSTAWCTFSFSGGSTYSGGSYGRTSRTRTVFSPNGAVQQTSGSESTNSGAAGNVYGNNAGGVNARWRVQGGVLSVSADGAEWKPVQLQVTYNSNGAPILKADGVEYMRCN